MTPPTAGIPGDDGPPPNDDSRPLRDLLAVAGWACAGCGGRCSAFEAVWSIALGFRTAPRCLPCLATGLGRDPVDLRQQLDDYVRRRECFGRAWRAAARLEATGTADPLAPPAPVELVEPAVEGPGDRVTDRSGDLPTDWDAGAMACGELVLALRVRLTALPTAALLRVRATDPAAPDDLPAWCRMTGHTLVEAEHPYYLIRRKGA